MHLAKYLYTFKKPSKNPQLWQYIGIKLTIWNTVQMFVWSQHHDSVYVYFSTINNTNNKKLFLHVIYMERKYGSMVVQWAKTQ